MTNDEHDLPGLESKGGGFHRRVAETWRSGLGGALVAILLGLVVWWAPVGQGVVRLGYDILMRFQPVVTIDDVIIIELDDRSQLAMGVESGALWPRHRHAALLDRLTEDHARLVVFDVVLADPGNPREDQLLAEAMKRNQRVVLAADVVPKKAIGLTGWEMVLPRPEFRTNAVAWGISRVHRDEDGVVRRHYSGTENVPSLSWAAAIQLDASVTNTGTRLSPRWINYYGPARTLRHLSFSDAGGMPSGYFRDKIVFVGGQPQTGPVGQAADEFPVPYTWQDSKFAAGVEIMSTMLLNLRRGDWLTRMASGWEFGFLLMTGLVFGFGLRFFRPFPGAALAVLGFVMVWLIALLLLWKHDLWFGWMVIGVIQIPGALAWSALAQWKHVAQETEIYKRAFQETAKRLTPTDPIHDPEATQRTELQIPDHTMLRCIGRGGYGEVWLARDIIGTYHAVKLVYRNSFDSETPFEREFGGMRKYAPISRNHPGWVHILHVGRDDALECFYYIMEVGDDAETGQEIDPDKYRAHTLQSELLKCGRLKAEDSLRIGVALADALDYLHGQLLVHRDIKPSNVVFIHGQPKFIDVGLVTEVRNRDRSVSWIGTVGYIAPEGPGTAVADIYSLGMLLYEASTGRERFAYPEAPASLVEEADDTQEGLALIISKACQEDPDKRYQSAAELRDILKRLQTHP